ncbi:hypothetical protein KBD20_03310 [Candidatus Saccharibacteria bacterium]|nr:hypothetical protein [Candidatus Saccharibacteria bacterium]
MLRSINKTLSSLHLLVFVAAIVSMLAIGIQTAQPALAVTAADWSAGNIIDDNKFYNSGEMTTNDIQVFLNSKMPSCDTWGTKTSEYGGGTRAQYGTSRGYPPPYTCLKDYSQNGVPAAQIIKNAANAYNINPKVLIVLLQKEQTLVTDDWPWSSQYRSATGYGCPDTAPCDAEYYGFTNQVTKAAFQFRRYATYPSEYRYKPYQNNTIQYNPNAGCGSSTVYIENLATAGLYNYTPYQPNASALNNLYGSGDGCGAYGNRNFWRLYSDWFGATRGNPFAWQITSQYAYTDNNKTTVADMNNLVPGSRVYVGFTAKNIGGATWSNTGSNAIMVGTANPLERQSGFAPGSGWLSPTRPALLKETAVPPGSSGTFEFWMTAPSTGGTYNERFNLIANGLAWFADTGLSFYARVQPRTYTWQMSTQYAYTDESKTVVRNMSNLRTGERVYVGFTARNTGTATWLNSGVNALMVGTASPLERQSRFAAGSGWLSPTRPALLKETSVAPGQVGTFEFWMTAPTGYDGIYHERFGLIANELTWLNDVGLSYYAGVRNTYTWQMTSQYAYTDANKTVVADMNNLAPGSRVYVGFTARNTGNTVWQNSGPNALMVGTASPYERRSSFSPGSEWLTATRPALLRETSVAPGQVGTFEFWMTAPSDRKVYNERFNIISNNITWLNDVGLSYYLNVR